MLEGAEAGAAPGRARAPEGEPGARARAWGSRRSVAVDMSASEASPESAMDARSARTERPVVLRDDRDGVATLRLNRPNQANALSEEMIDALQAALDARRRRRGRARRGDRRARAAPSAPATISSRCARTRSAGYYEALFARCRRLMATLREIPQPVIAQVHGHRHGGRLSARRELRPRRGLERGALRDVGHQRGSLLRDAGGPALARRLAQARLRDADDGRIHRRAHRAATGAS